MPYDTENKYHWLCRLRGHVWRRDYYQVNWHRNESCHRCAHILRGTEAAAERWRRINAAAKAEGCKCGASATHVRYGHGTIGGVPSEHWSCAAHVNVNGWSYHDGKWSPGSEYTEADLMWLSRPEEHR